MKIVMTFGLGDFIAMEAFMSDEERSSITEIYYATRARDAIDPLISAVPIFPNLQRTVTLWNTWSQKPSTQVDTKVHSLKCKDELIQCSRSFGWGVDLKLIEDAADYNTMIFHIQVLSGKRPFTGSTLLKHKVADIEKFNLPEQYGIVNPYSPSDRHFGDRDFDQKDWAGVIRHIENRGVPAVVINYSDDYIPEHDLLINLNKKTTVPEAVEICKKGSFYAGIDSWVVVLMSKFLDMEHVKLKTRNLYCYKHLRVFCAPHKPLNNVFLNAYMTFEDLQ